jgi:small-conductance mechanosensitive channel
MPNERQWLQAEQSGQEELAERIFARVVAELPPIEPSTGFVNRTVQRAWQARARGRHVRCVALIAAALLITIAAVGSIYELTALAMGLVVRSTLMFSHGLVWLLTSAGEGARWWWIAERIGAAARDTIAAPSAAACVAAAEMVGLLAIYAFQRLLGRI